MYGTVLLKDTEMGHRLPFYDNLALKWAQNEGFWTSSPELHNLWLS